MFKSSKRNRSEGALDRIGGRLMEMIGRITGKASTKAKGKAARGRGASRTARGRAKRAAH
jgi:uncharacterized protein YjbJ (UPF0337 family)